MDTNPAAARRLAAVYAQQAAESEARFAAALADYQTARAGVAAATTPADRFQAADRFVQAERVLGCFVAFRRDGAENERIVNEIIAERAARRQ